MSTAVDSCAGTRDSVLFIGTQFSNLYTSVDTPARGRMGVCVVFVCLVFACKYVLGHSRVSQPLSLRLCLLRHLGFLTSPHASPICRRRRINSYRLFRRFTPDPPPIPWAYPPLPSYLAQTSTIYTYYDNLINDSLINLINEQPKERPYLNLVISPSP